ncbi:MAG: hypothetical protein Q9215_002781 [Flavoplaca cf. flavocitrina]
MDLVAGVRKEGSRGGRDAFKWEDVKDDQHRENYLGHSLMAPVGRWQKNKDLSWYAKGDNSQAATDAANARAEEIRRIKEAEQDALSEALGYPVQPRLRDSQLAGQKEVEKALKETTEGDEEGGKGVGFGSYMGIETMQQDKEEEVMKGYGGDAGGLKGGHYKAEKREHRRRRSRSPRRHERRIRSISRDRDRHRDHGRDRERERDRDSDRKHRRYEERHRDGDGFRVSRKYHAERAEEFHEERRAIAVNPSGMQKNFAVPKLKSSSLGFMDWRIFVDPNTTLDWDLAFRFIEKLKTVRIRLFSLYSGRNERANAISCRELFKQDQKLRLLESMPSLTYLAVYMEPFDVATRLHDDIDLRSLFGVHTCSGLCRFAAHGFITTQEDL